MIIQTLIVFAICSHNDHNQILTPYVSIVCATSDCLFVLLCTHIDHNQIWSLHVLIVCGRWDLMSMSSALKLVSQQMTLRTEGEIMLKGLMLSISLQEGQTFHPTFSVPGSSGTSGLTYYQLGSPNQTKGTKKFKSLIKLYTFHERCVLRKWK